MTVRVLGGLTAAMLAASILPANAAWHGYFNNEAGFSFNAPGEVKTTKAAYKSAIAGQRNATLFTSVEDNVEFKVTVVEFGRTSDDSAIIKEATSAFQGKSKVLADNDARVNASYGRKLTVDLPNNGGRSMAAIYFNNNHLIEMEVTVLPANGDPDSGDMGRFVDSLAFYVDRSDADMTELKLMK